MYCPVDGIEYREGVTRCPEHDVDLVPDPPDVAPAPPSFWQRLDAESAARAAFAAVVGAGVVYAAAGVVVNVMFPILVRRDSAGYDWLQYVHSANQAAWSVGVAALGALAAGVLVRVYSRLSSRPAPADSESPPLGWDRLMSVLFTLVVLFAAIWVATGVATAQESARLTANPFALSSEQEMPSDTMLDLFALHYASFACGVGSLAIMGALVLRRAHARIGPRV